MTLSLDLLLKVLRIPLPSPLTPSPSSPLPPYNRDRDTSFPTLLSRNRLPSTMMMMATLSRSPSSPQHLSQRHIQSGNMTTGINKQSSVLNSPDNHNDTTTNGDNNGDDNDDNNGDNHHDDHRHPNHHLHRKNSTMTLKTAMEAIDETDSRIKRTRSTRISRTATLAEQAQVGF